MSTIRVKCPGVACWHNVLSCRTRKQPAILIRTVACEQPRTKPALERLQHWVSSEPTTHVCRFCRPGVSKTCPTLERATLWTLYPQMPKAKQTPPPEITLLGPAGVYQRAAGQYHQEMLRPLVKLTENLLRLLLEESLLSSVGRGYLSCFKGRRGDGLSFHCSVTWLQSGVVC